MARQYTLDDLNKAVEQVEDGADGKSTSATFGVPYRTLMRWVKAAREGIARKKRGPSPALVSEAETCIVEWVVGMQEVGTPASRSDIIAKASTIFSMCGGKGLGGGWYRRFMDRHPELVVRTAEAITKARTSVKEDDVISILNTVRKRIDEHGIDSSRIFNMDETTFETGGKSKRVVVSKGTQNTWSAVASTSFHLTIMACGSADGFVIPPVFVLPGASVRVDVLDCSDDIPGAAVTTTASGFVNGGLFSLWIEFFAKSVPSSVQRPLLLLVDRCSSHISKEVVEQAEKNGVMIALLPANGTHMFQPLDVAVFEPFKSSLHRLVDVFITEDAAISISKQQAISLSSTAWQSCSFSKNIKSGFKACGLFPLDRDKMLERLKMFQHNGTPAERKRASWLKIKTTVQDDILVLPPERKPKRKRKTAPVSGRLLTKQLLHEIATERVTRASKKKKPSPRESSALVLEAIV